MRPVQRAITMGVLMGGAIIGVAAPAAAQAVHSLHLGAGLFAPRSYDARAADDVWV